MTPKCAVGRETAGDRGPGLSSLGCPSRARLTIMLSDTIPRWRGLLLALVMPAILVNAAAGRDLYDRHPLRLAAEKEMLGSLILDGSFVHNVGELHLNITNWGLIGSRPQQDTPYSAAPSAMWPAGSGNDFLFAAGLWVGALKHGTPLVSTGQVESEFLPTLNPVDIMYSSRRSEPAGERYPFGVPDDDGDGLENEDPRDGIDNDLDGQIDEDFAGISDQEFRAHMRDDTPLSRELWPSHEPLEIDVVQRSFQWATALLEDAVAFEYEITNVGNSPLEQVVLGFYADPDIGSRNNGSANQDDLVGFKQERVIASDGLPLSYDLAYMYDCPQNDGVTPGYIGFLFLNTSEPPTGPTIRSFHHFTRNSAFELGGAPTNDEQRYELMSGGIIERDPVDCSKANDYSLLIATRPGQNSTLQPGQKLSFQMAIVMGEDYDELSENAAETVLAFYGEWFDRDGDRSTGRLGRETKLCLDDFGGPRVVDNPLYGLPIDCGDPVPSECQNPFARARVVTARDLDEDGCVWVNFDCAFEFSRGRGRCHCFGAAFDPLTPDIDEPCTGRQGKEYNVRWLTETPPPAPRMRVWQADNRVHVYWSGEPEGYKEDLFQQPAFEGYQIWRANGWTRPAGTSIETGPSSNLWSLVDQFDVVNSYERIQGGIRETLNLGNNTGLDALRYVPKVLRSGTEEAQRYGRLRSLIQQIVQENPGIEEPEEIRYRDDKGRISVLGDRYPGLAEWECCTDMQDTLAIDALGHPFYEYIDTSVRNGFYYFYAVGTSSIRFEDVNGEILAVGLGPASSPRVNFSFASPQSTSQSSRDREQFGHDIYVVPNPATRESLAKFNQLTPNEDDPTGVHIEFRNLPRSRNTVTIYTLAGDVIEVLRHDGRNGDGTQSWNLVSRNGQEIVSGIYLYSIESSDSSFDRIVGRFVVVR